MERYPVAHHAYNLCRLKKKERKISDGFFYTERNETKRKEKKRIPAAAFAEELICCLIGHEEKRMKKQENKDGQEKAQDGHQYRQRYQCIAHRWCHSHRRQ
jgi:hypothetical protein